MVKKSLLVLALVTIIGVLIFGAVNRTLAKNENASTAESGAEAEYHDTQINLNSDQVGIENGLGTPVGADHEASQVDLLPASSAELTDNEIASLMFMREEEKLAHDVYLNLSTYWILPIFQNISLGEQSHTEAIKTLLDRYELTDPASNETGVFMNPDLQALYNDLIVRGSQSLSEALLVGATIEEIDIMDLQEAMAETDKADIQQVYDSLLNGSYNHLRAFVSIYNRQTGSTYAPLYLDNATFQTIISDVAQSGGSGNGKGNGQGNNNTVLP
jgi:hypothetical protein